METPPHTPFSAPAARSLRRSLTKLHAALYISAWSTVLGIVLFALSTTLLIINHPFREGVLNPFDRGLTLAGIFSLVVLILLACLFGIGARRAKTLSRTLGSDGHAGCGTPSDWVSFWRLNPFSRSPDTNSINARAGMRTNLRIISAFMMLLELGRLISTLDYADRNWTSLPEQPWVAVIICFLIAQSTYGLFAFGLLWQAAGRLNIASEQPDEFGARQSKVLGHIGNFMLVWATYRLVTLLKATLVLLDL